jgi:small GTP-binding protein
LNEHSDEAFYPIELIMLGDYKCGKTSLITQFIDEIFKRSNISTLGIDRRFKYIDLDGKRVKLMINDTAG